MTENLHANPAPGFQKHAQHRVDITAYEGDVRVTHKGQMLADTSEALEVVESGYQPVYYVPISDVALQHLAPFERTTYCPFKGDASYWALADAIADTEPVAWAYEAPYDEATALAGHIAFYADRVEVEAE